MIDFEATVESQYANSPTIMQLIKNLNDYINPTNNLNSFFQLIWNVNTAEGYGLDVWGRIVGIGRILKITSSIDFFGFEGPPGASGEPWNQGIFYNGITPLTQSYTLLDEPYRTLILAKAMANICNASIPAINQILINLFGVSGPLPVPGNCYVIDGMNMTMLYVFSAPLDPVQTAIVYQSGVLPKPAGVSATAVIL